MVSGATWMGIRKWRGPGEAFPTLGHLLRAILMGGEQFDIVGNDVSHSCGTQAQV